MNISRYEGCTVTGALAVSAFISDAVTVVHGPAGCTHHNISLLHSTMLQHDVLTLPVVSSTRLSEQEIIFGGEGALEDAIAQAAGKNPGAILVISTCIAETIGDDVSAVCARDWGVPVLSLRTAGFLGGNFNEGFNQALKGLSPLIKPYEGPKKKVNIVGEKNLEFEVEENFDEVQRLLSLLGLDVNVRLVRNTNTSEIKRFAEAELNILREDAHRDVGIYFAQNFGIPFIPGFPAGFEGTIRFIKEVGKACGVAVQDAVDKERTLQSEIIRNFDDLSGMAIRFGNADHMSPDLWVLREIAERIGINIESDGTSVELPVSAPVGTAGIRRMLHRWRRSLNA